MTSKSLKCTVRELINSEHLLNFNPMQLYLLISSKNCQIFVKHELFCTVSFTTILTEEEWRAEDSSVVQRAVAATRTPRPASPRARSSRGRHLSLWWPRGAAKLNDCPGCCGSVDWVLACETVADSSPSQGTCLGCGPGPQGGHARGNPTLMFLSLP